MVSKNVKPLCLQAQNFRLIIKINSNKILFLGKLKLTFLSKCFLVKIGLTILKLRIYHV